MVSMKCIYEQELEDKQLLAYLDREADLEIVQHLEKCEYCMERANALASFHDRLTHKLYRVNCPSPVELGEYHLRTLPSDQMLIVSQHVRECPHCIREVSQLEEYLSELAPKSTLPTPMEKLIARLVSGQDVKRDSSSPSQTPAFSSLRGEEGEPYIYQADDIQIVIDVLENEERPGRKTLLGLITGLKSNELKMEAYREGKLVATTIVNEMGNFIFSHLLPGSYDLLLSDSKNEILSIKSFIV
jgi:hypothetical protein